MKIALWYGSGGGLFNSITVAWNHSPIFTLTNLGSSKPDYVPFTFRVTATGLDTLLVQLDICLGPGFSVLDDVSVTPTKTTVPEPSALEGFAWNWRARSR